MIKPEHQEKEEKIIRILSTDVPGNKQVYAGLTRIKGVSWSLSNAVCHVLGISKERKIVSLNEQEIKKISEFIKNPKLPDFMLNRRKDFEAGKSLHLIGSDLDLIKEFDIKRLKKIRSYRGLRHALGQPVRGQRTRSHFRTRGKKKAVGVMNKPKAGKKQ
ncbi:30S ribosomal protein S13 [Candidatus Pacearchaeota archaeon]|nr:30S ribosomal protein S13 [Candidatus Pacearchaeota archaeon]